MRLNKTNMLGALILLMGFGQLYMAYEGVGNLATHAVLAVIFLIGGLYLLIVNSRIEKGDANKGGE